MSSIPRTRQLVKFVIHIYSPACYAVYTLQGRGEFQQYIPVTACSDFRYRVYVIGSYGPNILYYGERGLEISIYYSIPIFAVSGMGMW